MNEGKIEAAADREIDRITKELEASRSAHGEILRVSAGQGEELIRMGRALQEAVSQVAGAEGEAAHERSHRSYLSGEIAEFVRRSVDVRERELADPSGARLVLITEKNLRMIVDRSTDRALAKLVPNITRPALIAALRTSTDVAGSRFADELEDLRPEEAFYKW